MYDDFWAGYNYGNQQEKKQGFIGSVVAQRPQIPGQKVTIEKPSTYDKTKFIRMQGPDGEIGEIYADGRMYIYKEQGGRVAKATYRKFGSRPFGIQYMQRKGWVVL
jgi:hypothetical protein